jgi:1-deoxyxylulose-5-phosphate synthase
MVVDRVAEVAAARGVPRAQVALAWLLAKPVITAPIVGATKLNHLDDALASVLGKGHPSSATRARTLL